jgi:hypothetical protein
MDDHVIVFSNDQARLVLQRPVACS